MKDFQIKAYSKSQLAMAYSPDIAPQSAVNRLARWIRLNKPLQEALFATGYRPKQQLFTPAQVRLIIDALGEP